MVLESEPLAASPCRIVVLGSHSNSDHLGLQPGQPDQDAEERVITGALEIAAVPCSRVMYTEMHGE